MKNSYRTLLTGVIMSAAACSSGAIGSQPTAQVVDPLANSKLQFAVGYATFSNGSVGLNVVETFRQPNGLAATLYNVPTITGPSRFLNSTAGGDAGTNRITQATLGVSVGAFGYGLCACNNLADATSSSTDAIAPALFSPLPIPFGGVRPQPNATPDATQIVANDFVGGPPAFPATYNGGYPAGFIGFPLGFTTFVAPAIAGTYTLDVAIPPQFTRSARARASLVGTPLPVLSAPTFVSDGHGGGRFAVNIPTAATETMIDVAVTSTCLSSAPASPAPIGGNIRPDAQMYYLTLVTKRSGFQEIGLPDDLGPNVDGVPTATLCSGSSIFSYYAIAVDYPAYEDAYPFNLEQSPKISANTGNADITTSATTTVTYP